MATRESGPENPARNTGSASTHRRATRRSILEAPMTSSDLVNSLCCCPTKWRAGSAAKPVAVGARRGREGPPGKAGSSARETTPILPLLGNFSGTRSPPRGISRPPMIRAKKRPGSSTGQSGEIAPSTVPLPVERLMTSPPFALCPSRLQFCSPSLAAYRILINDRQTSPRAAAQALSPFALVPNICPPSSVQAILFIFFR